jgi:hypothetical protein
MARNSDTKWLSHMHGKSPRKVRRDSDAVDCTLRRGVPSAPFFVVFRAIIPRSRFADPRSVSPAVRPMTPESSLAFAMQLRFDFR